MLEISDVGINFGGLAALQNITFGVEKGKIVSVIGPNGAGKTTLFNIVTGFLRPRRGDIAFEGQPLVGMTSNAIAALGVVRTFQKTEVFPELPVIDCVKAGTLCGRNFGIMDVFFRPRQMKAFEREIEDRAGALLEFVGLSSRAGTEARHLSYGEQRLLEIAVGLAAEPRLLLLDEPASGMNVDESYGLTELIGKLRDRDITILLVEHNMNVVMDISDHIVVLNHGEKIAEGTPEEIASNPEVITAYLGSGWTNARP